MMTNAPAASVSLDRRVLQSELLDPLPDELLSWRPGQCVEFKKGNEVCARAIYYPYIHSSFLRQRLTDVLGLGGWKDLYAMAAGVYTCHLELLPFPAEYTGVGFKKMSDPGDTEHAGRTLAFRDACTAAGICGSYELDGAVTQWIDVKVISRNKEGKPSLLEPLEPLTRALLKHSGASRFRGDAKPAAATSASSQSQKQNVSNSSQSDSNTGTQAAKAPTTTSKPQSESGEKKSNLPTVSPEAKVEAKAWKQPEDPHETENIIWTFAGQMYGARLNELPSWYLQSQMTGERARKVFDITASQYDGWWHKAVQFALEQRAAAKQEPQMDEDHGESAPADFEIAEEECPF